MKTIVCSFTDTYSRETYEKWGEPGQLAWLDLSDISGTDLYCDEKAQREIRARIEAAVRGGTSDGQAGIHFIDSGNYHYMTRLFTAQLCEPYTLAVFDHHTDMKPAAFEGLLSCGEWVKTVLENDENARKIWLVGPPESALAEIPEQLQRDERLCCVSEEELLAEGAEGLRVKWGVQAADAASGFPSTRDHSAELPLYLSIDKDILRPEDAWTNWDQGNVSLELLLESIECLLQAVPRLLGADICGLLPHPEPSEAAKARRTQERSDLAIWRRIAEYAERATRAPLAGALQASI